MLLESRDMIGGDFMRLQMKLNSFFKLTRFSYRKFLYSLTFWILIEKFFDFKSSQHFLYTFVLKLFKIKIIVTVLNSIITVETHSVGYQHHAQGHQWYWDYLRMNRLFFLNMNNDKCSSDSSDVECCWVWCWPVTCSQLWWWTVMKEHAPDCT